MIEKFQSAEKAYQMTPFTGFRTFVKGKWDTGKYFEHMPFFPRAQGSCAATSAGGGEGAGAGGATGGVTRNMMVDKNEVEIEEVAAGLGLQVRERTWRGGSSRSG